MSQASNMSVTEYALIKLKKDPVGDADFANAIRQSFDVQQTWVRQHQPHLMAKDDTHFSALYAEQGTSSHVVLITAPWDSPEGHGAWIRAEENQTGMKKLAEYIAEDPGAVMLLHLEPYGNVLPRRFAESKAFKTYDVAIGVAEKNEVTADFREVDQEARKTMNDNQYWAGWGVEQIDNMARLIIFLDPAIRSDALDQFLDKHKNVVVRTFQNIL